MQLVEAVFQIAELASDYVICAKAPFTWGSDAVLVKLTNEYSIPDDTRAAGFEYVLGKEDVLMVLKQAELKQLSNRSVAELVCHYAVTDAWPSWFDDIPEVIPVRCIQNDA